MILGAHESIGGGMHLTFIRGGEDGCDSIQVFTKNANQWQAKELSEEEVALFEEAWKESRIVTVVAHDTYLINLASPEGALFEKSIDSFVLELKRCDRLGIGTLVTHPGSTKGRDEDFGIRRVARAIDRIYGENREIDALIALETTAGQGSTLGWRLEQLRDIREATIFPEKVKFCIDTCHIYAAGYDLKGRYEETMQMIDSILGLLNVAAFHLNDSKRGLGSRIDRHEHIGKGELGLETFSHLVNDERLRDLPGILETPPTGKGANGYRVNLQVLRDLIR